MSDRKTRVLAAFGVLSFLTVVGATAATSQNSGIDVYNGDIRMHGNNITGVGVVKGIQDNWVNESGDTMNGDLTINGALTLDDGQLIDNVGKIQEGPNNYIRLGSNVDDSDNGMYMDLSSYQSVNLIADKQNLNGGPFECTLDYTNGDWNCDGSKNWVHSLNSTHDAYYSSQESPEVRAVYEGNTTVQDGVANVTLPRHFSETVSDDRPSLRVQATPHSLASVAVTERTDEYVVIEASKDVDVDFRVTGIREGYEDKQVVRKKEESGGGN